MRYSTIRNFIVLLLVISLVTACSTMPPNASPVARDDISGVQNQLESYIQHEMEQSQLAGLSIALVDDQKIIWTRGFGWADVKAKVPAGPDTRYRVGSISKLFTDTAAMQLVADRRLDLDAPVQDILPWFKIGSAWPDAKPITLRQLMSHHSGLPRDVQAGMWMEAAPSPQNGFRAMLRTLAETQVDAPPERMFSYSNVALDVVGAMVEAASGQPFAQRVQESILMPLGMQTARFTAAIPTDATMARGYLKGEKQNEPALRDIPAGGLNASVTDLAYFLMMQFSSGRNREGAVVLPASQQAAMLQPQYPDLKLDGNLHLGLGWILTTLDTERGGIPVASHGGATWYFRSQATMLPEQKLGVIVLSNDGSAGEAVDNISRRALALLLEMRTGIRATPKPGFVPAAQPWTEAQWQTTRTACAGDYMTPLGFVSIKPKGSKLIAQFDDRQLELREGELGRLGLRYRLFGLFPVNLGILSEAGFECAQVDGRQVLFATLQGTHMLLSEKLAKPSLPADISRWTGRYRPHLLEGEIAAFDFSKGVRVFQADDRLWAEYQMLPVFGGKKVRQVLQPVSETVLRAIGPLADTGPVIQLISEKDQAPRFRFSGWTFDKVDE
jgi:CubicO group peptidase (beta-lactamase class C family)